MDYGTLFKGAASAYGYDQMRDDLRQTNKDVMSDLGALQDQIGAGTQFQPYGVKTGIGTGNFTEDGYTGTLSSGQQNLSDRLNFMGYGAMKQSQMDPAAREQQVYDRIRATQMPGEQRALQQSANNARAGGRSGMFTNQYGGSPEQFAQQMAMAEANNNAALGGMNFAQQEQMNQYNQGLGMLNQANVPYEQMRADMGMGLNAQQMNNHTRMQGLGLMSDFGLGMAGTQVNMANLDTEMYTQMLQAILPTLGQVGDTAGSWLEKAWEHLNPKNQTTPPIVAT